jgi:hypothetical protein
VHGWYDPHAACRGWQMSRYRREGDKAASNQQNTTPCVEWTCSRGGNAAGVLICASTVRTRPDSRQHVAAKA